MGQGCELPLGEQRHQFREQPLAEGAVLDYQLEGGTAVDVLNAVRATTLTTSFLVLTNHTSSQYRRVCLEAGASQFFDKTLEFHCVKDAIAATVA